MKARKSSKRGRPKQEGVARTPSGQKSRSNDALRAEKNIIMAVAAWRRLRENPGRDAVDVAGPEYGSAIHMLFEASEKFKELNKSKVPPPPNPFLFTKTHLNTAERLGELYSQYRIAIGARSPRSGTDFSGVGGHDNLDPFDKARADRDARAIASYAGTLANNGQRYGGVRRAILESCPLGMMAVEAIVFNNQDCPNMLADLRLALNAVDRLWRMARAA